MSSQAALILRVMASSIAVANRAGKIVRDVMSKGDLGIVEKVGLVPSITFSSLNIMSVIYLFRV